MKITDFNMDYFSLKGKNALVTGGNSGLGQAFSLALAKAGANVYIPSIIPEEGETRTLLENEGVKAYFEVADLTADGVPKQMVENAIEKMGSLDILVNCAGIIAVGKIDVFTREMWDKMTAINLTAAYEMARAAAGPMVAQKSGKIINVCSMYSFLGYANSVAYVTTKHGIAGLTKAMCDELGQYNIQSNGIAPGFFETKVTEASRKMPGRVEAIINHTPAGRWGVVHDLMGTTVFLASRASDFVNGHILAVDGGYLVR
ncbi:MAG: SDR family NAD(P)-dependent oxidoreductase [Oscillospiraceae bacterium]